MNLLSDCSKLFVDITFGFREYYMAYKIGWEKNVTMYKQRVFGIFSSFKQLIDGQLA